MIAATHLLQSTGAGAVAAKPACAVMDARPGDRHPLPTRSPALSADSAMNLVAPVGTATTWLVLGIGGRWQPPPALIPSCCAKRLALPIIAMLLALRLGRAFEFRWRDPRRADLHVPHRRFGGGPSRKGFPACPGAWRSRAAGTPAAGGLAGRPSPCRRAASLREIGWAAASAAWP